MATLRRLSTSGDTSCDVVFVHGLDGEATSSWGFENNQSWATWLTRDHPDWCLWTLGYEVPSSKWRKTNAMPLKERAINVIAELEAHELGQRPLFFICHSMGGLLVKQILRWALANPIEYGLALRYALGVVFFSTPHQGAMLADQVIKYLNFIYRPTQAVDELRPNTEELADLARFYRENAPHRHIDTAVFYEGKNTKRGPLEIRVVDRYSAETCILGVDPVPFDADHYEICIPVNDSDTRYQRTRQFIENRLRLHSEVEPCIGAHQEYLLIKGRVFMAGLETKISGRVAMVPTASSDTFVSAPVQPGDQVQMVVAVISPDGGKREAVMTKIISTADAFDMIAVKGVSGSESDSPRDGFPVRLTGEEDTGVELRAGPIVDRLGHMRFRACFDQAALMKVIDNLISD